MTDKSRWVRMTRTARIESGEYCAGEIRRVTGEDFGVLVGNGWAVEAEGVFSEGAEPATPESVTLEVHNSRLGVTAGEVG